MYYIFINNCTWVLKRVHSYHMQSTAASNSNIGCHMTCDSSSPALLQLLITGQTRTGQTLMLTPFRNLSFQLTTPDPPSYSQQPALLGAFSKACQPWSVQWLGILASCLQSGWGRMSQASRLKRVWVGRDAPAFWSRCDGNAIKTGPCILLAIECTALQSGTERMRFNKKTKMTFRMFDSFTRCCHSWVYGGGWSDGMLRSCRGLIEWMKLQLVNVSLNIPAFADDETRNKTSVEK